MFDSDSLPDDQVLARRLMSTTFLPGTELIEGELTGTVGRYLIQRRLGSGGAGDVYLATDPIISRPVAIKVIGAGKVSSTTRFRQEMRILASLRHPNIVSIYDAGELEDGKLYYVMEFAGERTLADAQLPLREHVQTLHAVAQACAAAHERGIVHRDLKPGNIILGERPVVVDFGLAQLVGVTRITAQGAIVGTPLYMAPEQVQGGDIDPRTDVYAIGAMLYEGLTGRAVFTPQNLSELLAQIIAATPQRPRDLRPEVPAALEAVCLRALEKAPSDRFPSVAALAAALHDWLVRADEPAAAPTDPNARPPKFSTFVVDAPEVIGGYRVVRKVNYGASGMGFLAHHARFEREVLIKLLNPGAPDVMRRLAHGLRAAARLRHAGIVSVHEIGESLGRPFVVQDHVEGPTLERRLAEDGPLPPEEAADIATQLGRALHYAHSRGVLHRDVCPTNVILSPDGARLTGFGLALHAEAVGQRVTHSGESLGSPAYAAPELLGGARDAIGPSADVYGLGSVLYAALVGRAPWSEGVAELERPSTVRAEVPAALDEVCMRCLALDPAARFSTAADVSDALARALRPPPAPQSASRAPLLVAGGILFAAAAAALALGSARSATPAASPAVVSAEADPANTIRALCAAARAGTLRHDDALEQVLALPAHDAASALVRELAAITAGLQRCERETLLEVATPTEAEIARGEGSLDGLASALSRRAAGHELDAEAALVIQLAEERLSARGGGDRRAALAPRASRELPRRLPAARLICASLGRLGDPSTVDALGAYLRVEPDVDAATWAQQALEELGGPRAAAHLGAHRRK